MFTFYFSSYYLYLYDVTSYIIYRFTINQQEFNLGIVCLLLTILTILTSIIVFSFIIFVINNSN